MLANKASILAVNQGLSICIPVHPKGVSVFSLCFSVWSHNADNLGQMLKGEFCLAFISICQLIWLNEVLVELLNLHRQTLNSLLSLCFFRVRLIDLAVCLIVLLGWVIMWRSLNIQWRGSWVSLHYLRCQTFIDDCVLSTRLTNTQTQHKVGVGVILFIWEM